MMTTSTWKKCLYHGAILIGLLLCAISFTFFINRGSEAQGVVRSQLDEIQHGDLAHAYSYTSEDFQRATTLEEFEKFVSFYPAFKTFNNIVFLSETKQNKNEVIVNVLLPFSQGETQFSYLMEFSKDKWQVKGIELTPVEEASTETDLASLLSSTKEYNNADSRYVLRYPTAWVYEQPSRGTLLFSGRPGTRAFYVTVSIQTVLTKKSGGEFSTLKSFINDVVDQSKAMSPRMQIVDRKSKVVKQRDGQALSAEELVIDYIYEGEAFRQWLVVVKRNDDTFFYVWSYTAPKDLYDRYNKAAKTMFESWSIY